MTVSDDLAPDADNLFTAEGRRTPKGLTAPVHGQVRRRFGCNQPLIDYAAIHDRISRHLGGGDALSVEAFQTRVEAIMQGVRDHGPTAGLAGAVHVPFFLPPAPGVLARDRGKDLEEVYIPAVGRSFEAMFPAQSFTNHHKSGLRGKLRIAPGSRHERLLQTMESEPAVGVLFISLTEFSIPAALEQMAALPETMLLSGGADLCAALVGSPDLLLRTDGYPPLIWMAALEAETPNAGYHFEAYGYDLNFNRRVHFGQAAEYWASGLTVMG